MLLLLFCIIWCWHLKKERKNQNLSPHQFRVKYIKVNDCNSRGRARKQPFIYTPEKKTASTIFSPLPFSPKWWFLSLDHFVILLYAIGQKWCSWEKGEWKDTSLKVLNTRTFFLFHAGTIKSNTSFGKLQTATSILLRFCSKAELPQRVHVIMNDDYKMFLWIDKLWFQGLVTKKM